MAPCAPSPSCQLCELCEARVRPWALRGRGRGVNSSQWARKQVCLGPSGGVEYLNPGVTILSFNGKNVDHRAGELVINSAPYHHINVFLDKLNISTPLTHHSSRSTFPTIFRKFRMMSEWWNVDDGIGDDLSVWPEPEWSGEIAVSLSHFLRSQSPSGFWLVDDPMWGLWLVSEGPWLTCWDPV